MVLIILLLVSSIIMIHSIKFEKGNYSAEEGEEIFLYDYKENEAFQINTFSGKLFTVKIRGNPTTGYGWFLENPEEYSTLIKVFDLKKNNSTKHYISDKVSQGFRGSGGYYYFRFQALTSGDVALIFSNKQIWNPSSGKTYRIDVTIA